MFGHAIISFRKLLHLDFERGLLLIYGGIPGRFLSSVISCRPCQAGKRVRLCQLKTLSNS